MGEVTNQMKESTNNVPWAVKLRNVIKLATLLSTTSNFFLGNVPGQLLKLLMFYYVSRFVSFVPYLFRTFQNLRFHVLSRRCLFSIDDNYQCYFDALTSIIVV